MEWLGRPGPPPDFIGNRETVTADSRGNQCLRVDRIGDALKFDLVIQYQMPVFFSQASATLFG
jgi:hypothetical protein